MEIDAFHAARMSLNHSQLVAVAAKWLSKRCVIVVTEIATNASEQPDALGWAYRGHSILVECKASRADFLADAQKSFRRYPQDGIGVQRYFLTMPGLISVGELPPKWGLLEVTGSRVRELAKSEIHECNNRSEIVVLSSLLRRVGQNAPQGVSIKTYEIKDEDRIGHIRSTLGIASGAEDLEVTGI